MADDDKKNDKKRRASSEELDKFWDIDSLVPNRKRRPAPRSDTHSVDIEFSHRGSDKETNPDIKLTVTIKTDGGAKQVFSLKTPTAPSVPRAPSVPPAPPVPSAPDASSTQRYIPPHTAAEERTEPPEEEYSPQNSLIHNVKIYKMHSTPVGYQRFRMDALRYFTVRGAECPPVPFFAYAPQYSQMRRGELDYYLWWRENFRAGTVIKADVSYMQLYVNEIITLTENKNITPEYGAGQLAKLYISCFEEQQRFATLLSDWICDFCLTYNLPPPKELYPYIESVAQKASFKEFYAGYDGDDDIFVTILMNHCSNYRYKSSKFYEANKEMFDTHIPGALSYCVKMFSHKSGLLTGTGYDDSKRTIITYIGTFCIANAKRKLDVSYYSFSRSHELRFLITDMIKYSENKLRASLGIKSRLSSCTLAPHVRFALDNYFDEHLSQSKPRKDAGETHEYDKFYDIPAEPLSPERAAQIEQSSWDTTKLLVDAFADDGDDITQTEEMPNPTEQSYTDKTEFADPIKAEDDTEESEASRIASSLGELCEFIRLAAIGDRKGQRAFALARGELVETVADRINECAGDIMGDILLTDDGGVYTVIEDYSDLAEQIVNIKGE